MNHSWKAGVCALALVVAACGPDDTGGVRPSDGKQDMTVTPVDMPADMPVVQDDMPVTPDMPVEPEDMPVDEGTPDLGPVDMGPEDMGVDMPADMPEDMPIDMMVEPDPCESNADCSAPLICVVDAMTGERLCQDPVGNGMTGDACNSGAECASNLCLNGACANPCEGNADCPNGFICEIQSIPLEGGGQASFNVCVEAPQPCLANDDCTDPEICVATRMGNSVELTCQDPVPGGGELGDMCVADSDCLSGLCVDGACSEPCQRPIDCSPDGSFVCEPEGSLTVNGQLLNVCKPKPPEQCLSNSQCSSPERCVATRGQSAIEFTCGMPNANGGNTGATCTTDSDCIQNLCLGGVCAPPCQGNGDCAAATDFTCEGQDVMLAAGTDNVNVCTPPVDCTSTTQCKINETCYVRRTTAFDTICRAPNIGGGSLGQVCSTDSECASNLCYDGRFGKVCSQPCDTASQCNVAGYTCATVDVAGAGAPVSAQICAPEQPTSCSSNNDCQTGTSCAIVVSEAGNALESLCIPSTGRLATGVACAQDDDCESRTCVAGSCADPCTDSVQCGARQLCLTNSISKGGITQTFDVCERLQDQACTSSDSCTDGVRVCGDVRNTGAGVGAFCAFPNTSGDLLGSDCSVNADCFDGLCLSSIDECSVVCDSDSDCSVTENQVCSTFFFAQNSSLDLCVRGCTDNGSCAAGDVCTINSDVTNDDIDQICDEPAGPGELGEVCTNGADCDTGLCLTTVLYNGVMCNVDSECDTAAGETCRCPIDQPNCAAGKQCATSSNRCSRICNDDGDCSGGAVGNELTTCSTDVNVTLPSGTGTKELSLCGQPSN